MYNAKMLIVMRRDLKMRKGKIAAQAGHACVEAILRTLTRDGLMPALRFEDDHILLAEGCDENLPVVQWFLNGEAKICVYVDGEDALKAVDEKVREAGFISAMICDAGFTEFHGEPTLTCLAIEPLPAEKVDPITGTLPLF